MVMQEMKALGKSFGTADNPCQATSDDVSVQDTEEKEIFLPFKERGVYAGYFSLWYKKGSFGRK